MNQFVSLLKTTVLILPTMKNAIEIMKGKIAMAHSHQNTSVKNVPRIASSPNSLKNISQNTTKPPIMPKMKQETHEAIGNFLY